jgi:hypothetical protein
LPDKEGENVTIAVLVADGFQDSEYFLPKIEIERLGVKTDVVSLTREISSRHPDDMPHFTGAIREWLLARSNEGRKRA